jgi:integrase
MSLSKKAKTLTKPQIKPITELIPQTGYPVRHQGIFLLSVRAGLRAKEIAGLTWKMVTDADGN